MLSAPEIADETRNVNPHESYQSAKIQQFGAKWVGKSKGANQRDGAYKQNVIAGDTCARMHVAEESAGDGIVPTHAIEQPTRSQVRARPGTDRGNQQGKI